MRERKPYGRQNPDRIRVDHSRSGVTVLELLVAMTMVSFIILVLYQMFDRTQAQMRNAIKQVDQLESGRAMMDIIYRDMTRMIAPPEPGLVSFEIDGDYSAGGLEMAYNTPSNIFYTNKMEALFFNAYDPDATPTNWSGLGYRVAHFADASLPPTNGFGSLYRYETNASRFTRDFRDQFFQAAVSNHVHKIAENIVHFRVNFYADGIITNISANLQVDRGLVGKALPELLEVEIGYIDEETATIARSLGSPAAARNFVAIRPEKVTLFRFQVPIKTPR